MELSKNREMPVRADSRVAFDEMSSAGYEPLEPYKNSKHPWKCKHLACGEIVTHAHPFAQPMASAIVKAQTS